LLSRDSLYKSYIVLLDPKFLGVQHFFPSSFVIFDQNDIELLLDGKHSEGTLGVYVSKCSIFIISELIILLIFILI